jgi:hypothetical protein
MRSSNTTPNGRQPDTTSTPAAVRRPLRDRLFGWLIADDPNPEYSRLDRMDGLGTRAGRDFVIASDEPDKSVAVREALLSAASRGRDVCVLHPKTGESQTFTPADVFAKYGAPAGTGPTA